MREEVPSQSEILVLMDDRAEALLQRLVDTETEAEYREIIRELVEFFQVHGSQLSEIYRDQITVILDRELAS